MAKRSPVLVSLDVRKILLVLVITVPLLLADMIFVLDRARSDYSGAVENYLETLARTAAAGVESFVDHAAADARAMGGDPALVETAVASAARRRGMTEEKLAAIDEVWQRPEAEEYVTEVVGGSPARRLRQYVEDQPLTLRALVTDRSGAASAASHKPALFYHGDQAWWTAAFGDGSTGAVHVSGAFRDPISGKDVIAVAAPLKQDDESPLAGVVRLFLPAAAASYGLEEALPGRTGEALVATPDGRLVSAARGGRDPRLDVEEIESLRPLLEERPSGAVTAPLPGGAEVLVGYSQTALQHAYPELDWVVLVMQDWREVEEPIERINWRALLSGLLAIVLLGAVAVYFSSHRPKDLDPLEELERN